MNIFNFKTTKKQIEIFETNVVEILKNNFPQIKGALELSLQLYSIKFSKKPSGIYLCCDYSAKNYKKVLLKHKNNFDLYGLKIFNKKFQKFEDITLFFKNNLLTIIEVSNPKTFHRDYDYCKLEIEELSIKEIYSENLDKKHTLDILKNVPKDKLNQLDIEDAIEIEFNGNYTILDMKNGNYIAVDKTEKVYRLNHDHTEKVKKTANNIEDFFDLYNGSKSNLIELMYEQTKTHSLYGNTN